MQGICKVLACIAAVLVMASCGGLQDIRIDEIRNAKISPVNAGKIQINMEAKVRNPSRHKVSLTKLDLNISLEGTTLATIAVPEKVVIPKRSNEFQPVAFDVRLRNVFTLMVMLQQKNLSVNNLIVEGELTAKTFLVSKKIKVEPQSVGAFTEQHGDFITPLLKFIK